MGGNHGKLLGMAVSMPGAVVVAVPGHPLGLRPAAAAASLHPDEDWVVSKSALSVRGRPYAIIRETSPVGMDLGFRPARRYGPEDACSAWTVTCWRQSA